MTTAGALAAIVGVFSADVGRAVSINSGPATFYGFGDDSNSELAIDPNQPPPFIASYNPTPTLVTIAPAGGPVTTATGTFHSAAVTATGELLTFGDNSFGQLGRSSSGPTDFVPAPVVLPGATGGVVQVATGHQFTLALTDTGQIYAFGSNVFGQLGILTNAGTTSPNPTPTLVAMPPTMSGTVVKIAVGPYTAFAATSAGEVYSWGHNPTWELGYNNNSDPNTANPVPTLIPSISGQVAEIAAGAGHTLVLLTTGQLYGFGGNGNGELANLTAGTGPGFMTLPLPMAIPGLTGSITHIAAGYDHSLVASSGGQLFAFGNNRYGQLGNATNLVTDNPNPIPTLVTLPGVSGPLTQLVGGLHDSLVVTSTGQLYSFGLNQNGQLGRPQTTATCLFAYNCDPNPALVSFPAGTVIASVASSPTSASTLAVAAPVATAPDAPTGVSATAGNASAAVSWTAPTSDGGSAITGYTVTSSPGGILSAADASATMTTVSGLTNGTAYTFTVKATNAIGTGPASAPSNSVTPATVPDSPTGVSATAGDAKATVSWTPPASSGGSPIVGYTATSSPGGITANAAANATSVAVSGLTNGTAYTFTVTAANVIGPSLPSAPSNSVTPSGAGTITNLFPASTTITSGTLLGGSAANLAADDGKTYQVNSTTKGTRATSWYGTFTNVPASPTSLVATYSGLNSSACTQTISIYKWTTKKWVTLDSRSVGSTKVLITNLVPSGRLGDYVSRTGQVQIRVNCSGKTSFVSSGDFMQIAIPGNPV